MTKLTVSGKAILRLGLVCGVGFNLVACRAGTDRLASDPRQSAQASSIEIVSASDVPWGALNPARGSAGPRAADLWGDRTGADATGFLVKFSEDFSSPPHIHNTTYRGIVIEGLIHNDDPQAAESWMQPGSYWTQPAGEVHITSAKGEGRLAYIEIEYGPYLVMPPEEASDNGERAINIHTENLVWLDASSANMLRLPDDVDPATGPKITFLWGDPQDTDASALLVEIPANYDCVLESDSPALRAVVVKGQIHIQQNGAGVAVPLNPGSYIGSIDESGCSIHVSTNDRSWIYLRSHGPLRVSASPVENNNSR